jgi:hypothetical protein
MVRRVLCTVGALALVVGLAPPARALNPVTTSTCVANMTPGAGLNTYPAWPTDPTALAAGCVFDARAGTSMVSNQFTVHDFPNVLYHNGAARTITNKFNILANAVSFIANDCTDIDGGFVGNVSAGPTEWWNRTITTSAGLPPFSFVTSIVPTPPFPNCTVTVNKPLPAIGLNTPFKIDNSNARIFQDGATDGISMDVSSAGAMFNADDVNMSISGANIPDNSTITAVNPPGCGPGGPLCVSATTTNPFPTVIPAAGNFQMITIGATAEPTTTRTVTNATYTAANKITSGPAGFLNSDVGLQVYDTPILNPCYIASVFGNVATLNANCTPNDNPTPHTVTIGDPTRTAPLTGDTPSNISMQIDLNPPLIAGVGPCSWDDAEAVGMEGTWTNPGSFVSGVFATQPANTKAIAEIRLTFPPNVVAFAGFIIERKLLTVGDPDSAKHYDLVFPNFPLGLAMCPSTLSSPGLGWSIGVHATTASQNNIALGVGRPNTSQVRINRASSTGSATRIYVTSDDGVHVWTGAPFQRLCVVPATTPDIDFRCGQAN